MKQGRARFFRNQITRGNASPYTEDLTTCSERKECNAVGALPRTGGFLCVQKALSEVCMKTWQIPGYDLFIVFMILVSYQKDWAPTGCQDWARRFPHVTELDTIVSCTCAVYG